MALLENGVALFNAGRFHEALAVFDAAAGPEAAAFAAHCLEAMGDRAGALRRLRGLAARRPPRARDTAALAGLLLRCGRLAEAERVARAALRLDPAMVCARQTLAQVLERRGEADAALAQLARILRARATDVAALEAAARLELRLGRTASAGRLAASLLKTPEGAAAGLRARAACAVLEGRAGEARRDLDRLLARAPDDVEARAWRAEALRLEGRASEAFAELEAVGRVWGPTLACELNFMLARMDAGLPLVPTDYALLLDLMPPRDAARLSRAAPKDVRALLLASLAELRGNRRPDATRAVFRGARGRLEPVVGAGRDRVRKRKDSLERRVPGLELRPEAVRRRVNPGLLRAEGGAPSRPPAGEPPDVYLIGLGIPELYAMSFEAHQAAARCRVLFINQPTLPALRGLGPELRPLGQLLGRTTAAALSDLARTVLAERRPGRPVGLAIYGHPLVYEPCCKVLLDEARRRKLRVEIVAGVSSIDVILAALHLPLERGTGLRAADPYYVLSSSFAPEPGAHTIVFKACQNSDWLSRILEKLAPAYPPGHRAALVECLDSDLEWVRWAPMRKLASAVSRPKLYATLVVPAAGSAGPPAIS